MRQITENNVTWIDIHKINDAQAEELKERFKLANSVYQELVPRLTRAKIEEYGNYIFIVLHFPVHDKTKRKTTPVELDFIVTPSEIITIHEREIPALRLFFENCDDHDEARINCFRSVGYLLFSLLDKLVDSAMPMLDHLQENSEQIEEGVFEGREKEMLKEIAIVKHDIIDFRRSVKPQKSVLDILAKKATRFFGRETDYLAQEVVGSNIRVWNTLENLKELIESLEETNNSLLSYKISDIVKILTIVSFITFPLSVIAGLFGMNVYESVGFVKNPHTWWIILSVMAASALIMITYFKKKRWF